MRLSKEAIKEFKDIYYKEFGKYIRCTSDKDGAGDLVWNIQRLVLLIQFFSAALLSAKSINRYKILLISNHKQNLQLHFKNDIIYST